VQRTNTVAVSNVASYRLLGDEADLERAAVVIRTVWDDPTLASPSQLRAYTHFGNPTIGAFVDDELVGVAIAFLAPAGGVHLHSHITGVLPPYQHLGLGHGLKLAQRTWCQDHGINEVTWTFDPMLAKNAHFNLRKLGAIAEALLPAFYGEMHDAINAGDVTDRLEVHWHLDGSGHRPSTAGARRVPVPTDYQKLRAADPTVAGAERRRVREALAEGFDRGLVLVDFDAGAYVFAEPT